MSPEDPWFRRSFGNSIYPINGKGWAFTAVTTAATIPVYTFLSRAEHGSTTWHFLALVLVVMGIGSWAMIRNRIDRD